MRGDDRVRHCGDCDQRVYDLSELTLIEAEALIVAKEGRMCVRFYERADGTMILRDCAIPRRSVASRIAGAAAVATLAGTLGCGPKPRPHAPAREPIHAGNAFHDRTTMGVIEPVRESSPEISEPKAATPEPTPLTHALDQFLEQPQR